MKRKIVIAVEVDVEFIDDIYLRRSAELGDLVANGLEINRNTRLVVVEDRAVEHLGDATVLKWHFE